MKKKVGAMDKERIKVVILCGGQGTRMREETEFRPKPLVDIGGRPIIWHIMKLYIHYGIKDFILCLGYKGEMIRDYFMNLPSVNQKYVVSPINKDCITIADSKGNHKFSVTLADTGLDSMTGDRIKKIERYVEHDSFMVTYGDGVSNINLDQLIEFHEAHGKSATMTTFQPYIRFGQADMDEEGRVHEFVEKPKTNIWVNAGYFIFNKSVFNYLQESNCVLEKGPLEKLAKDGELHAYQHDAFFYPMDTYREYKYLTELWNQGAASWKVW